MRKLFTLLLLLLLWAAPTSAAVTVNSQEASGIGHNSTTSPLTWSFTNTAGNYLVVGIDLNQSNPNTAPTIGAVSYNGTAMTLIGSVFSPTDCVCTKMALYGLASPATGSNTVSVAATFSGSPTNHDIIAMAISFSGVDVSVPGTSEHGSLFTSDNPTCGTTSCGVSVTSTTSGNYVVSVTGTGSGATITATSPTILSSTLNVSTHTFSDDAALGSQSTSGGSVTAAFSTGVSDAWAILATEVKASGGGGGGCTPTGTLLGVEKCH